MEFLEHLFGGLHKGSVSAWTFILVLAIFIVIVLIPYILPWIKAQKAKLMPTAAPVAAAPAERMNAGMVQSNMNTIGSGLSNLAKCVELEQANTSSTCPAFGAPNGERLVNGRGEPDFWEIRSELDRYRTSWAKDAGNNDATERAFGSGLVKPAERAFDGSLRADRVAERMMTGADDILARKLAGF